MTQPFHPDLLQAGDMVRHYRVVRHLGSGGFASVFLVEHGGRPYRLKIASRPPGDEDEAREDERAFREVVAMGHFRHPNLLAVREMGRWPDLEGGHFFFVTDYIPGSTFNMWRWRTQAPLRRLIGVSSELALVMAEVHEHGVCHRDIKADNVLVREEDDKPFLIDFGSVFLPGAYKLTREIPPGTFHNMPPEVAAFLRGGEWEKGAHFPAHPAADLYMFGAFLYEALTDCHPFNPRLPHEKLLLAIEFLPPVEPVRLEPRVPPGLNGLVMRLLAKEPEQRPPSARAVHEELMRMLEREGDTEPWKVPYAFAMAEAGETPPGEARPEKGAGEREVPEQLLLPVASDIPAVDGSPPSPEREAPAASAGPEGVEREAAAASGTAGPGGAEREAGRSRGERGRVFAVLAFVLLLVLLGIGWGLVRTVSASALAACSGAASTALVPPAPSGKGCEALHLSTPKSFSETLALLCTASAHLLACTGAPVRPDAGGFLERCPLEARMTAVQLGFEKQPFTEVVLATGTEVGAGSIENVMNFRNGLVEGWMELPDRRMYWVSGEAKVFQERVYMQFDQLYLDALYPTRGRVPSPICAVAVSQRDRTKLGVFMYRVDDPSTAKFIDPSKVVYRGSDAAIIGTRMVDTYVQLPGRRFPD
jgi:serine/threonine-protein kinase